MIVKKQIRKHVLSLPFWIGWWGLLLVALVSCDKNDIGNNTKEEDVPIRFEINLSGTRVATDMDLVSRWEEGDEVGVFAVKTPLGTPGHLQSTGNYLHNVQLIYQNGSWISDSTVYYPNDGELLYFYAYYPYDIALTDPTAYDFSVSTDQRSDYNTSDFLVAKTGETQKSIHPVLLAFEHQCAVIQVEVLKEVNMPHLDGDFTVTLTSVQTGAKVDFNNPSGEYDLQGSRQDIRMHKVSGSGSLYRAVVPAHTLAGNTKVTFKQTDAGKEIDMEYTGLANKPLTAGKAHKYKLTLSLYDIDPNHTYSVGDVYPHAGPVLGIVYEVSNGGKNGKVISLDEFQGAWSDHNINITSAQDNDNGLHNMRAIVAHIRTNQDGKDWANFPVFEWVQGKNNSDEVYEGNSTGVWYLPAINELFDLYNWYNTDRITINNLLTQAGGVAFSNEMHFSSTNSGADSAEGYDFTGGTDGRIIKTTNYYRTRCILTF